MKKAKIVYFVFLISLCSVSSAGALEIESHKKFIDTTVKKNINWDNHDSKILQLIEQGIKTINLPNFIPLSLSAIEKRKSNIKKQLIMESGSDKELIDVAKNLGFL